MAAPARPSAGTAIFHKLYALDTVLPDLGRPSKAKLEAQIKGHVVGHAELVGTYHKRK
jgi:phosphatidylethanolamine-binding protein (PEBP) family uncharacterized protein